MYPKSDPDVSPADRGSLPYFYRAGLFQLYVMPRRREPHRPGDVPRTQYDFSRDPAASRHPDHPRTAEQTLQRGYLLFSNGGPVTTIISDKAHTSWLVLDDAITQVRERHEIYHRLCRRSLIGSVGRWLFGHSGDPVSRTRLGFASYFGAVPFRDVP
jgi:hypothetical protein